MKHYTTLLMDADDTIFDFPRCEYQALREALTHNGLPFNQSVYDRFTHINNALWKQFEKNEITGDELRVRRFAVLMGQCFDVLIGQCFDGSDGAEALAEEYVRCLSEQAVFLDNALPVLEKLSAVYQIYIITNGLKDVQRKRLERSGLYALVKGCFISDEMGVRKPMKAFFDKVLAQTEEKDPRRMLVVGDSLTSDMQGGYNAGLDTCLYDPQHKTVMPHPLCTYRIERLAQLLDEDSLRNGA